MNAQAKTILITGSTDGVGRLVARQLAASGARVLIHGRNLDRGNELIGLIRKDGGGEAEFYPADFASLAAVRGFAHEISKRHNRLDVLINNAGIGSGGSAGVRQTSADGYELRFAVNYLAGFLLTELLLPLLLARPRARIVNVASLGQHPIDFSDLMLTRNYEGRRAYGQSKLAQIMLTFDLARQHSPDAVTANCLHPATFMDTTMVRQSGTTPTSTVEEGANAILNLVTSTELEGESGGFFDRLRRSKAHPQAYDEPVRAQLRAISRQLTGRS
jgi:NAD(P)-dependent dehydrogenase (short-subunit alcohol dehydrogenase family)